MIVTFWTPGLKIKGKVCQAIQQDTHLLLPIRGKQKLIYPRTQKSFMLDVQLTQQDLFQLSKMMLQMIQHSLPELFFRTLS